MFYFGARPNVVRFIGAWQILPVCAPHCMMATIIMQIAP